MATAPGDEPVKKEETTVLSSVLSFVAGYVGDVPETLRTRPSMRDLPGTFKLLVLSTSNFHSKAYFHFYLPIITVTDLFNVFTQQS